MSFFIVLFAGIVWLFELFFVRNSVQTFSYCWGRIIDFVSEDYGTTYVLKNQMHVDYSRK